MSNAPDFSNLESLKVDPAATAEYIFYDIVGDPQPVLTVKPAAECNKPYLNALLKGSKRLLRRARRSKVDLGTVKENREQDIRLFSKYVVTGWQHVVDANGEAVEFSAESCQAFFKAMPPEMFDEFRVFCGDLDNFRAEDDLDGTDAEELGKN